MKNLDKLKNNDKELLTEEANVLNLLNSGLASQARLLESVLKQLPNLEVSDDQREAAQPITAEIDKNWKDHLQVTRAVMRAVDITKRKEKGQLSCEQDLDLINEPGAELVGCTDVVPETCVKNIQLFDGSMGKDLDIRLEGFLKSIFEAGSTNKLSHKAMKTLIIRKLSPQTLMLIESYLDTSDKIVEEVSLRQIVSILEECYSQTDSCVKLESFLSPS